MCQFVEDIYEVANILKNRQDFKVLLIRDYIQNRKPSGYRSYHMVLEYPVQLASGEVKQLIVEVQIRKIGRAHVWTPVTS